MDKALFRIGRVVKVHGVRGKIKVKYYGEDLKQFFHYRTVLLEDQTGRPQAYEIVNVALQAPLLILQLQGVDRIEDAEPFVGKEVLVTRASLPDLEKAEYYWEDLLGMGVETEEGKKIGKVKEILPTRAHDVYVVEGKRREILLPATEDVIKDIDCKKGVMTVRWIEGLWEAGDEV